MLDRILLRISLVALLGSPALAKDLLEKPVVFTRLPVQQGETPFSILVEGPAQLVLRQADGALEVLSSGFYSALDPEISFDGERLLFAGKRKPSEDWNIFEMDLKDRTVRQISRGLGNCRKPAYQSTFYTIVSPEPWYQITFVSDAGKDPGEGSEAVATDLYSCRLNGTQVRRLTFNPSHDTDPVMLEDGRVLYAAQQCSAPGRLSPGRMALFTINSDGTDLSVFSADEGKRFKRMPCPTASGLIVFVESSDLTLWGGGHLAAVRFKRHLHSYRRLTRDEEGIFHSPAPYGRDRLLVSRRLAGKNTVFGLYVYDLSTGSLSPFHRNPEFHCIQARVVSVRKEVDGRSSVVTETDPNGQLYALDVTINDLPDRQWLTTDSARRVRFLEGVPGRRGEKLDSPFLRKRVLGEIPLQKDGSFFVEVPANIPIQIQLLDADGLALRTCSWIWTKNHERRGCIGCHEDQELSPPNRLAEAVKKPPIQLTLPPRKRRVVDFRRDVYPLIESGCANRECHRSESRFMQALSDRQEPGPSERARRVFEALVMPAHSEGEDPGPRYVVPGRARTSPLIWHVFGRRTTRPWDGTPSAWSPPLLGEPLLSAVERRILAEWVDFGAHWRTDTAAASSTPERGGSQ